MTTKAWIKRYGASLAGKTVAVSGSTGGLGKALCDFLARCGARLVLLDRNPHKLKAHKGVLEMRYRDVQVECILMDLADLPSVERAARRLEQMPIDVLICNAGAYAVPRYITSSGFDNVFQINFAAPYYLVRRLMPHMEERKGRIVVVGSIAHRYGKIDPHDPQFRTRTRPSLVYGNAKRCLMIAMHELFLGRDDVTLGLVHPGIAVTGITAHYPEWLYTLIQPPMKVIFMHPRRACLSIVKGILAPTEYGTWYGPWLFDVWGLPIKSRLRGIGKQEKEQVTKLARSVYRIMSEQGKRECAHE